MTEHVKINSIQQFTDIEKKIKKHLILNREL